MLQWNPRLFAVLALVMAIAAFLAEGGISDGFQFGW
jgi:hypothetical protein